MSVSLLKKLVLLLLALQRLLPLVNQLFSSFTIIKTNSFLLKSIKKESYEDIVFSYPQKMIKKKL